LTAEHTKPFPLAAHHFASDTYFTAVGVPTKNPSAINNANLAVLQRFQKRPLLAIGVILCVLLAAGSAGNAQNATGVSDKALVA
jgi:hypothetical protein